MTSTWCILGGAGPFGEHLAAYLLAHTDVDVLVVGRSPEKPPAYRIHELEPHEPARYEYQQIHAVWEWDRLGDLLEARRPAVIVNFAALASAVWKRSWLYYDTNVAALARLVEPLLEAPWLERWVQIGSSEVYGSHDYAVAEDQAVNPTSPYAVSKVAADMHLLALHRQFGFPLNILRPSNAYGPGQQLYRVIPRAALCALTGQRLPLEGGGKARKSYIHARDLARAIVLVAENARAGEMYHVGPSASTPIRDVVDLVAHHAGVGLPDLIEEVRDRIGQDGEYLLDSRKIRHDVGWVPEIGLSDGICETVGWVRANLDFLRTQSTAFTLRA